MIDAALENSLPLLVLLSQIMLAERAQDANRERPIMMPLHRILQQAAQTQQSRSGDGGGGSVQDSPGFRRRVEIPGRDAVAVAIGDVVIGAGFGRFQKARIAAVFIGKAETVERPGGAARPA